MTVLWLIQPDKLELLFKQPSLGTGGFLLRVMPCQVDAEPTAIDRTAGTIADPVKNGWEELVHGLLGTYHRYYTVRSDPYILEPTQEAIAALDAHQYRVVGRRRTELADADSYAARWNEWAWRLTVVVHAARYGADAHGHAVDADTANTSIALADWFVSQQLELLSKSRALVKLEKEKAVFDLLVKKEASGGEKRISAREVQRARIAVASWEAAALLRKMEADGKLTSEDQRPEGGHTVRYFWRS